MRNLVINGVENDYYLVSEDGKVFNRDGRLLKAHLTNNGYYRVKLSCNCKRGMYLVHRLVAEAYLLNPHNYPIVNHKNNDRGDNRAVNLEWCDNSHNQKQRFKTARGTKCKPVLQYSMNGEFIKEWETPRDAFLTLGIQAQNIAKVCRGERKSSGGYIWRYK